MWIRTWPTTPLSTAQSFTVLSSTNSFSFFSPSLHLYYRHWTSDFAKKRAAEDHLAAAAFLEGTEGRWAKCRRFAYLNLRGSLPFTPPTPKPLGQQPGRNKRRGSIGNRGQGVQIRYQHLPLRQFGGHYGLRGRQNDIWRQYAHDLICSFKNTWSPLTSEAVWRMLCRYHMHSINWV